MKSLCAKILLISAVIISAASVVYAAAHITLKDSKTKMSVNLYPTIEEEEKELLFYSNTRFGYSVLVPKIFTKVVTLPSSADGMILESKDKKSRFRVSGGLATDREMLKKSYDAALKSIGGKDKASYHNLGDNSWELYWWKGNVFHQRRFFINEESGWCDCEISYPPADDDAIGEIINRALQSLVFPVG